MANVLIKNSVNLLYKNPNKCYIQNTEGRICKAKQTVLLLVTAPETQVATVPQVNMRKREHSSGNFPFVYTKSTSSKYQLRRARSPEHASPCPWTVAQGEASGLGYLLTWSSLLHNPCKGSSQRCELKLSCVLRFT